MQQPDQGTGGGVHDGQEAVALVTAAATKDQQGLKLGRAAGFDVRPAIGVRVHQDVEWLANGCVITRGGTARQQDNRIIREEDAVLGATLFTVPFGLNVTHSQRLPGDLHEHPLGRCPVELAVKCS